MVESWTTKSNYWNWDHPGHQATLRARLVDGRVIERDISGLSPIQVWDILRELETVGA